MKIAFFGSPASQISNAAFSALAARHDVVLLVLPQGRGGPLARLRAERRSPMLATARARGIRRVRATHPRDDSVAEALERASPDISCLAIYPRILPANLLERPPLGTLNLHPSLLPRHRGPLPLFWAYFHGDEQTGMTVHRAVERADAGEIYDQAPVPIPRGARAATIEGALAATGAELLVAVLGGIEAGTALPRPQDERAATPAPLVRPGQSKVDFESWPAARVWHFLRGLAPRHVEPLRDALGRPVAYRDVGELTMGGLLAPPGTVERTIRGWLLYCRDGTLELTR